MRSCATCAPACASRSCGLPAGSSFRGRSSSLLDRPFAGARRSAWQIGLHRLARCSSRLRALPDALFGIPLRAVGRAGRSPRWPGAPRQTLALVIAVMRRRASGLDMIASLRDTAGLRRVRRAASAPGCSGSLYYGGIGWYRHLRDRGRRCGCSRCRGRAGCGGARRVLVVVGYPLFAGDHERTLLDQGRSTSRRHARVASYDAAAGEDVLYSQPRLLESELAGLLPRRPGRPNLYLVERRRLRRAGRVPARGRCRVDALFAERFGTRGRSVRLVNNRSTHVPRRRSPPAPRSPRR